MNCATRAAPANGASPWPGGADVATVRITYTKSAIGYRQDQKDTIRALGFRRLNQTVEHEDSPALRGMIYAVTHLVTVQEDPA